MPRAKKQTTKAPTATGYPRQFGTEVRRRRIARDLTQQALAARVGISLKYLGEVERGEANPTAEMIGRLASALEWDGLSAFTWREPLSPADAALRDEFAKTAERALLPLFNDPTLGNGWDHYDDFAETCYGVADAMLRARAK